MTSISDTCVATVTVHGVDLVHRRRLIALAVVAVDLDGIAVTLQGVQVRRGSADLRCTRHALATATASGPPP